MGDTIILIVSFPLIIAGMILTITWGMSAAGARGQGGRKQTKEACEPTLYENHLAPYQ
jgi:hypothetical protein